MSEKLKVRDIVLAEGACTDSNFGAQYGFRGTVAPIADFTLLRTAAEQAEKMGLSYQVGSIYSSDVFYNDDPGQNAALQKLGVLAVEMEAAALYLNAARCGKRALAICTVSDHLLTGEALPAQERQTSFREMMELSLETAVRL